MCACVFFIGRLQTTRLFLFPIRVLHGRGKIVLRENWRLFFRQGSFERCARPRRTSWGRRGRRHNNNNQQSAKVIRRKRSAGLSRTLTVKSGGYYCLYTYRQPRGGLILEAETKVVWYETQQIFGAKCQSVSYSVVRTFKFWEWFFGLLLL